MLDREFVARFAADWIDAWNSHDLTRILAHYTDDFEMNSPAIAQIAAEPSGRLRGKQRVGDYWAKALRMVPHLHFELQRTLVGVDSVTLYYRGHRGMSAEVLHFDAQGKVARAFAHYDIAQG
ncbi:MAG: nuclear transport factor 2 family protein [Candidatus Lambdaproteobacteria bacterium]|nr:nuclear transport factor 2 family protein [Candidatus Lambdaproteobacteria bacterium]